MIVADHELDSVDQALSQFGEQSLQLNRFPETSELGLPGCCMAPTDIPTAISGVWLRTAPSCRTSS